MEGAFKHAIAYIQPEKKLCLFFLLGLVEQQDYFDFFLQSLQVSGIDITRKGKLTLSDKIIQIQITEILGGNESHIGNVLLETMNGKDLTRNVMHEKTGMSCERTASAQSVQAQLVLGLMIQLVPENIAVS